MAAIKDITVLTTATSILTGSEQSSRPVYIQNESSELVTLAFAGTGDTYALDPNEWIMVIPGMVVTGTSVSGTAVVQVLRGVVPDSGEGAGAAYDSVTGSLKSWRINPEWAYIGSDQQSASSLPDGTTYKYWDMENYHFWGVQIADTPGAAGSNLYTLEASRTNDGTAQGSVGYIDVTQQYLGKASFSSAELAATPAWRWWSIDVHEDIKFLRIKSVRTGDSARQIPMVPTPTMRCGANQCLASLISLPPRSDSVAPTRSSGMTSGCHSPLD
jgi:hypothetical protein